MVRTAPTPDPSTEQLSSIGPPHFATPPKSPSSSHTFAAGAATVSLTFTSDMVPPSFAALIPRTGIEHSEYPRTVPSRLVRRVALIHRRAYDAHRMSDLQGDLV